MGTFHRYFPPRPDLNGYEGGGGGEIKWVGYGDVKSIATPLPSLFLIIDEIYILYESTATVMWQTMKIIYILFMS